MSKTDALGRRRDDKPAVLVIEDDIDNQNVYQIMLEDRYEVLLAANGEDMRTHLRDVNGRIVVALVDLALAGSEDGFTLTRYLRQQAGWAHIPIIAITAHVLPEWRDRAFEAGCDAFLTKPINLTKLREVLDQLIAERAPKPS
jgi:two-component system, sensor histidine kinase and response regulator